MIKITLLHQDKKLRINYHKFEKKYKIYKSIQSNQFLPFLIRQKINLKINRLRNNSISKMVNRCIITNRGKSIYKPFNISRHQLKKLGFNNEIVGIKKSSW